MIIDYYSPYIKQPPPTQRLKKSLNPKPKPQTLNTKQFS